ncbi:hypothetical protein SK60_03810, partial [Enterobacter sp. BIDMC99]
MAVPLFSGQHHSCFSADYQLILPVKFMALATSNLFQGSD